MTHKEFSDKSYVCINPPYVKMVFQSFAMLGEACDFMLSLGIEVNLTCTIGITDGGAVYYSMEEKLSEGSNCTIGDGIVTDEEFIKMLERDGHAILSKDTLDIHIFAYTISNCIVTDIVETYGGVCIRPTVIRWYGADAKRMIDRFKDCETVKRAIIKSVMES